MNTLQHKKTSSLFIANIFFVMYESSHEETYASVSTASVDVFTTL